MICDSNVYPYNVIPYQDKWEAAYFTYLGTRVVDNRMQVIRNNSDVTQQSIRNCLFITFLKLYVIDFSSMSLY